MRIVMAFVFVAVAVAAAAAGEVAAEGGNRGGGSGGDPTVDSDGEIAATRATDFVITSGGSGSGPRCDWTHLTTGAYENTLNTDVTIELEELPEVPELPTDREPTPEEIEARDQAQTTYDEIDKRNQDALEAEQARRNAPAFVTLTRGGATGEYRVFTADCPNRAYGLLFIPPVVDDDDIRVQVVAHILEQIPDVIPNTNPSTEVGGFVNLGLWLAVQPAADVGPFTAEAGPDSWITITGTHTSTRFDMGNGDTIECDGIGDPIENTHPDLDVVEESPVCGYTYRESSLDDDPYSLGIDMIWTLPWQSNSNADTIVHPQTSSTPYDIDEIQTLGTS